MSSPRVFISTDIGGGDKDDDQSLVHALLYADVLRIEGISSTDDLGRKSDILQVINAYAKDYSTLSTHGDYPTPEYLRSISFQGATHDAPSAGYSKSTEASRAIIAAARKGSAADPLYVLTWGGETDIAQALHDAPDIANKIRLLTVDKQDANATRYLEKEWKNDVWWIQDMGTFRGMYVPSSGANRPIQGWAEDHAQGHGALGNYFYQHTRDLYANTSYDRVVNGLKMGDTPTLLYLINAANLDDPTKGGWGGDFVKTGHNYWTDSKAAADRLGNYYGADTVAEHRSEILADFADRLDRLTGAAESGRPDSRPDSGLAAKPGAIVTDMDFVGKAGSQSITGGSGSDTVNYSASNDRVWINLATGNTQHGHAGGDKLTDIENLIGSRFNDIMKGNAESNRIEGGAGNDQLEGAAGQDRLYGGAGNDKITGGKDGDLLFGGEGRDTFVYTHINDSRPADRDVIGDFVSGQDKLSLKAIDARSTTPQDEAFKFIEDSHFSKTAGELRLTKQSGGMLLEGDVNGDGTADLSIFFAGVSSLSSHDFLL